MCINKNTTGVGYLLSQQRRVSSSHMTYNADDMKDGAGTEGQRFGIAGPLLRTTSGGWPPGLFNLPT